MQAEPGLDDDEYSDYDEMPETASPVGCGGAKAKATAGSKRKIDEAEAPDPAR